MLVAQYPRHIERQIKALYESLSEKDRRRYAAIEAAKLGYGGPSYMRRLLGVDYKTTPASSPPTR